MKIGKIFLIMIAISMIMIATTTAANIGNEEKPEPVNTSEIGYFVSGINPYGEIEGAERLGNEKKPETEKIGSEEKPETERIGNEKEPNAEKPDLAPESTPSPTPTPTVNETKIPEINNTTPTPEPTPSPDPTLTITPTPEPTPSPTPKPISSPTPTPVIPINETEKGNETISEPEPTPTPEVNETAQESVVLEDNNVTEPVPVNETTTVVNDTEMPVYSSGGNSGGYARMTKDEFLERINGREIDTVNSTVWKWNWKWAWIEKWESTEKWNWDERNVVGVYEEHKYGRGFKVKVRLNSDSSVKEVRFEWDLKNDGNYEEVGRMRYFIADQAIKALKFFPEPELTPTPNIEQEKITEKPSKPLTVSSETLEEISKIPEKVTVTTTISAVATAIAAIIIIIALIVITIIVIVKKRKNKDKSQ